MTADAHAYLATLIGTTIPTLTGRPNTLIELRGTDVMVGTARSPNGHPVPIRRVQRAMDILYTAGEIEISVKSLGYRSAFIGAVLATLPGATTLTDPRRVRLRG
jgi:hypothetical protein